MTPGREVRADPAARVPYERLDRYWRARIDWEHSSQSVIRLSGTALPIADSAPVASGWPIVPGPPDLPLMRCRAPALVAHSVSHAFGGRDAAGGDGRARDGRHGGCVDHAQDRDGAELAVLVGHGQRIASQAPTARGRR